MESQSSEMTLLPQQTCPGRSAWSYDTSHQLRLSSNDDHDAPSTEATFIDRQNSGSPIFSLNEHLVVPAVVPVLHPLPAQSQSVSSGTESNMPIQSTQLRSTILSWSLEIFAISISAASMVAVIVVLAHENKKSLASWQFTFSLNTVISALGTLARTTLAFAMSACIGQQKWSWLHRRSDSVAAFEKFDEASRGPWGGTRLFFWLRFRHWASLGALVTVGALAFDPFIQAVISTYGQLDDVTTGSQATIAKSLRVDTGTKTLGGFMQATDIDPSFNASLTTMPIIVRPDFGGISSIYGGFQNDPTSQDTAVKYECPTGNCTYPAFLSAAVCSSCRDVSSQLAKEARYGNDYSNAVVRTRTIFGTNPLNYTIFSLSNSEIRNQNGFANYSDRNWFKYGDQQSRTLITVNTTYVPGETLTFSESQTMMMAFTVLRVSDDWLESRVVWESSKIVATECALYLCANTYHAQVKNSVLEENISGSWTNRDPDSYLSGVMEDDKAVKAWVKAEAGTLYHDPDLDDRHDLRIAIPSSQSEQFPETMATAVNFSHAHINGNIAFLRSITQIGNGSRAHDHAWVNVEEEFLAPASFFKYQAPTPFPDLDSPVFIDALWNSTNLTLTFDTLARSMTKQIRNIDPSRHKGIVHGWVVHVQVDWAFLALPIAVVVAGILFVILTIIESTRLKIPVWKESALPTLLYGLDDETQTLLRAREKSRNTKKAAIRVRFDYDKKSNCMRLIAES